MNAHWHAITLPEVEERVASSPTGLTGVEALRRGTGRNALTQRRRRSLARVILTQLVDPLVIVLLIAAALSAVVTGEFVQATVILVLVGVNAGLGASQEWRAARSLDALVQASSPETSVVRDGALTRIPTADLVVGDVVVLGAGDRVSGDLRLVEAIALQIDESALTGESLPVGKDTAALDADTPLADRSCMAYASTFVRTGRGRGLVVAVGDETEVGRIARSAAAASRPPTPLQRQLARLGLVAAIGVGVLAALLVVIGIAQGRPPLDIVLLAVALAVGAIPEGLVAITAIVLARGVRRMAERGAIVRTLSTVETLGAVDVICVDKTGTLTQNSMVVADFWQPGDGEPSAALLTIAASCNDAAHQAAPDPLEDALLRWALDHGGAALGRRAELPFDPTRRRMTTAHDSGPHRMRLMTKGGVDEILAACSPDPQIEAAARREHHRMAETGLRVIAFAERDVPEDLPTPDWERGLHLVGLVGLEDPPRDGAAAAVARAHAAGISLVMVTGDHAATATAIADRLDLRRDRVVLSGSRAEELDDAELAEQAPRVGVFARVVPETKMRIVRALQSTGATVAMTGDGVNDGPALSAADVGCAMGRSGTDVAREAADLVITDDHLDTIVDAVAEGRRTHDNLTKVVEFLLTTNAGELILIVAAVAAGIASPLSPAHILTINLLTDGGPALALAADPPSRSIMRRAPSRAALLTARTLRRVVYQGGLFGGAAFASFLLVDATGELDHARTAAFLTLAAAQVLHAFSVRTRRFAFSRHATRNPALQAVAIGTLLLLIGLIYIPGVSDALELEPLDLGQLLTAAGIAVIPFVVIETIKAIRRATVPRIAT